MRHVCRQASPGPDKWASTHKYPARYRPCRNGRRRAIPGSHRTRSTGPDIVDGDDEDRPVDYARGVTNGRNDGSRGRGRGGRDGLDGRGPQPRVRPGGRSVRGAGNQRSTGGVRRRRQRASDGRAGALRLRALVDGLARHRRRPGDRGDQHHGAQRHAPRGHPGGPRTREACLVREARGPHSRRDARGGGAGPRGGRPDHVRRLQLPLGAGRPARVDAQT